MSSNITHAAVFGLGYVGSVMAGVLSNNKFKVTAVDIDPRKVEKIHDGESPIVEEGVESLIEAGVESGHLRATDDAKLAISASDISFICTGTPVNHDGTVDISSVLSVADQVGRTLADNNNNNHITVIRSTVPPGTTKTVKKRIDRGMEDGVTDVCGVINNPEFIREGSAVDDFYDPPVIILGAEDEKPVDRVAQFYKSLGFGANLIRKVDPKVSEMIKYASNSFHGMKVAFANEVGRICNSLGIDGREVMDLFCEDEKLNISSYYLQPGFSFGGSCLPKDTRAFASFGDEVETELINSIIPSNDLHTNAAFRKIAEADPESVGVLGLSFKSGTDDMRQSPAVKLIRILLDNEYCVHAYDHTIDLSEIIGSNSSYVEQFLPEIDDIFVTSYDEVLSSSEHVAVCKSSNSIVEKLTGENIIVYDFVGDFYEYRSEFRGYRSLCRAGDG